ncbi:MAG: VWA domain-containing protein [Candidatus Lokiarchaeota archaeon]|nr:VWA domain-containing protein [Candidatus Lokiarchaeota archaeon]
MIKLPVLYDLFEKDYFSDLFALINIGKRISGKQDIHIEFNQNSQLTFTDGKFIYLPKKIKDDISSAQGLVAHESGHIGYGSFELSFIKLIDTLSKKYNLPSYFTKQVINVVEDVRVNALNSNKFPGFYNNLRKFTLQLLPDLILIMKRTGDLLVYINLFMDNYNDFQEKPKFRTRNMSDEDWRVISTAKKFLLKSLTPASSIITIDQLCKVLKKFYKKKRVPREESSNRKKVNNSYYDPAYDDTDESEDYHDWDAYYESVENEDYNNASRDFQKIDNEKYLKELKNSDFMEDPCLYEDFEMKKSQHHSFSEFEPLINHFEEFVDRDRKSEPSEINTASEKVIDKIKDMDLSTEDIEKLIEQVEKDSKNDSNEFTSSEEKKTDQFDIKNKSISQLNNEEKENILQEQYEILNLGEFENFRVIFNNAIQEDINPQKFPQDFETFIKEISQLMTESQIAMEGRLLLIENLGQLNESERKVNDVSIENEEMRSINLSYKEITKTHHNIIAKLKYLFQDLRNQNDIDTSQKRGRLNNKFIKAVTSDFKYDKCFTRKLNKKELKILLMVDISGSMAGIKLEAAKVAMVMLCESLYEIAQLRIVLFTGEYDALNIHLKDFEEYPDIKKFDKFGRHNRIGSNLDGVSLKHEAAKLEKNVLILVISDGQPAGTQYGLNDAVKEIQDVKKKFKVYAFSIDANGDYLNKLYGNNWILTKSSDRTDLAEKLTQFCKLVVKEFYR